MLGEIKSENGKGRFVDSSYLLVQTMYTRYLCIYCWINKNVWNFYRGIMYGNFLHAERVIDCFCMDTVRDFFFLYREKICFHFSEHKFDVGRYQFLLKYIFM